MTQINDEIPSAETVLVAGATGETGRLVVEQLLQAGKNVRAIVRSPEKLPPETRNHPNLTIIQASILEIDQTKLAEYVLGCSAIISCLGHVLNLKGIYGKPRYLCTDAIRNLCDAVEENAPDIPTRIILMNTVGVANPSSDEPRELSDRIVLALVRTLIPPQRDNEHALAHLIKQVGRNTTHVEWCAVRPDSLIDSGVSEYVIQAAPSTAILTGAPTARANVAHFMVTLVENSKLWDEWKFRCPVIMDVVH